MKSSLFRAFVVCIVVLVGAAGIMAQPGGEKEVNVEVFVDSSGTSTIAMAPQIATYEFVATHGSHEGKVVKNAPYSAEGKTETSRVLADGTKITRTSKTRIYRDSEGRTRREIELNSVGPWSAEGGSTVTVTINDPTHERVYVTHRTTGEDEDVNVFHAAHDFDIEHHNPDGDRHISIIKKKLSGGETLVEETISGPGPRGAAITPHSGHVLGSIEGKDTRTESMGQRTIEGVMAEGTRTTSVIPEGKIGNDRPITITSERWYSPELQAVVLRETKDPMSGDVTYRLTNIIRAEPDPSLFEEPEQEKLKAVKIEKKQKEK